MIRALLLAFALTACASSKPAEKPAADPAPVAAGAASATAEVDSGGDDDPCAGKTGKAKIDCKKAQQGVKTKFLFKSSGGDDDASADDDDDE